MVGNHVQSSNWVWRPTGRSSFRPKENRVRVSMQEEGCVVACPEEVSSLSGDYVVQQSFDGTPAFRSVLLASKSFAETGRYCLPLMAARPPVGSGN